MSRFIATLNTLNKDKRNGWRAESRYPLADTKDGTRVLYVSTSKDSRGALWSHASVHHAKGDGTSTHIIGFGGPGGDYSATLLKTQARATEKAVAEQHAKVCADIEQHAARAQAHYAAKETADELNARRDRELQEQDRAARGMNYIENDDGGQQAAAA